MASGRQRRVSNLFVGEIGDNRRAKSSIFVYRLREPKPTAPNGTRTPRSFEFVYPDGRHDAEALLVRPGSLRIFIVTKDRNNAAIYAAPRNPSTSRINRLKRVRSAPAIITDGVFITKNRFVLRGYNTGYVYRSLTAKPRTFKIPDSGESITKGIRRGTVLTGSEGRRSDVWRVPFN
jgi:hypothetical protein